MDEAKERIRQYILTAHLPGETASNLQDDTPLRTSGVLDSLATLALVSFIEKEFNVELEAHETGIESFDSISSIASLVAHKQGTA